MSYIEILVLRHLLVAPAHGYELRKRVEASSGIVLHNNSLYPALHRFEQAGAVTKHSQTTESRPTRLVYALTETGRELLHDLLADFPPELARDDGEFLARVGQFSLLDPAEQEVILATRLAVLQQRLDHMVSLEGPASDDEWSTAITTELSARTRSEIDWIETLRAQLVGELP